MYWGTERLELVILFSLPCPACWPWLIAFGVPGAGAPPGTGRAPPLAWSRLGGYTRRLLFAIGLNTRAHPETFLLLRGHELGMDVVELLLLWAAMHVVKSAVAESAAG